MQVPKRKGAVERICTFVDWENIRISLRQNFLPEVTPAQIAAELHKLVEENGEWRGGIAYADWTKQERAARAFADVGFESKMVLTKRGGTDRSDMMMSLDIQEALSSRASEFDTVFIISGDSDFQEVIRRAKDKGFKVVVVGVAPTTASGIISVADQYVAIEARMGLNARVEIEMEHSPPDRDWTEFVQLLAELEAANKYVGLKKLVDEWMAERPLFGDSYANRRSYLEAAEGEAIAVVYPVAASLSGAARQVMAVRLNREHPVVAASLVVADEVDDSGPGDAPEML
jgi:uncharacterized protein (TIGR00288 family)